MSVRVSCPFCNAQFTLPEGPPPRRVECPRCNELLPLRNTESGIGSRESDALSAVPSSEFRVLSSNGRSVARTVAIALLMGVVGLGVGLFVYFRGSSPKGTGGPDAPPSATATPPAELGGLGFLPADCNIVFAVQPGPLLAYAGRTNQNPRELLTKAGIPGAVLATLDKLGITLPQIDHIVGGTKLADDVVELRLALALVLRRPLADEDKFLDALAAQKTGGGDVMPRYKATAGGLPLLVTRMSPTIWVFGLDEKDFDALNRGGPDWRPGKFEALVARVPADAAAWFATDSDRWADKGPVKLLVGQVMGKKDWLPVLAKGQAVAAGLSFDDPPRLRVFVRCVDSATGEKLRAYFAGKATAEGAQSGGAGEWAMFDTPIDPASGYATVKQFLDEGK